MGSVLMGKSEQWLSLKKNKNHRRELPMVMFDAMKFDAMKFDAMKFDAMKFAA